MFHATKAFEMGRVGSDTDSLPPTTRISWIAVGTLTLLFTLLRTISPATAVPFAVQVTPMILSALVLGLPHGAIDHLVPFRVLGRAVAWPQMTLLLGGYVVLAGLYGLFWFLAPGLAFIGFLIMTWLHWGQGDLYFIEKQAQVTHLPTRASRTLALLVRGGLPMVIPVVAYPEVVATLAATIAGLTAQAPGQAIALLGTTSLRAALGVSFAALVAFYLKQTYRQAGGYTAGWRLDAGEIVLLGFFFALVPPWLAIGIYFCLWHALRHIYRLLLLTPSGIDCSADRSWRPAVLDFARDAALPTVVALVALGAAAVLLPQAGASLANLLGLYLALIAALTLPHCVIVTWMDRRETLRR